MQDEDELTVLIYRQTHTHDPCQCGVFGIRDCMGKIRGRSYDAVIGIGAKKPANIAIARKLTWVGINARKQESPDRKGPLVTFDHFCHMNEKGPMLCNCSPLLYHYMFECGKIPRFALSTSRPKEIRDEIVELVNQYRNCLPSQEEC